MGQSPEQALFCYLAKVYLQGKVAEEDDALQETVEYQTLLYREVAMHKLYQRYLGFVGQELGTQSCSGIQFADVFVIVAGALVLDVTE